jgi:hypothetical protein
VDTQQQIFLEEVHSLMDAHRAQCLWYLRADYYPQTLPEARRVLQSLERHGDRDTFQKAATLRQWLSQHFSEPSAGS